MPRAIAKWWTGLSDFHKGLSLILTTIMATGSATSAAVLSWHQFRGLPDRVRAVEQATMQNRAAVDSLKTTLQRFGEGQDMIVCLLLADINGTQPLECTR